MLCMNVYKDVKAFFFSSQKSCRWVVGYCCGISNSFHRDPIYYMTLKEDVIYVKKPR